MKNDSVRQTAYNLIARCMDFPAKWWESSLHPFWVPHRRGWTEIYTTPKDAVNHPLMQDQVLVLAQAEYDRLWEIYAL